MESREIIVVGAGLAGLTAAWHLQRQGWQVRVLESSGRPGGRMHTERRQGALIDTGAQFLSSGYRHLPALAEQVGLRLVPTARAHSAVLRGGRWRAARADGVWSALSSGLLSPRGWLRLGLLGWRERAYLSKADTSDYGQWAALDDATADEWLGRSGQGEALSWLVEPMLEGFYFQQPETTSRALAALLLAIGARRERTMTLEGGMGKLPEALAARLDVRYREPVLEVREEPSGASVQTRSGGWSAAHAVLAVPAPQAQRLWRSADPSARPLLATPYSSSINVSLRLDHRYRLPEALRRLYGMLVPRPERRGIAALALELHKSADRRAPSAGAGPLVQVMLSDAAARTWMSLGDEALLAELQGDLDRLLPGCRAALEDVAVFRWPEAEPRSPVGRARAVARYRSLGRRRVWLAGDYMSVPFTEGAVESGAWVAREIGPAA